MALTSGELPRGVIENQLEQYYRAGIVNGQTRTALYNSSVGTDLGIRKTDSLAISRAAQIDADKIISLREAPMSQPIQPSMMLDMNVRGAERFQYNVEATLMTTDGFLLEQNYIPVYSESIMTKEDIKAIAESMSETKGGTEVNVSTGNVTEAYRNTA